MDHKELTNREVLAELRHYAQLAQQNASEIEKNKTHRLKTEAVIGVAKYLMPGSFILNLGFLAEMVLSK